MDSFRRRIYPSLGDLWRDVQAILSQRHLLGPERGSVDPAFRERLMLAVTAVNGCRYCSYVHARHALSEGISAEEIDLLSEGTFEGSPSDEVPALLYAQHWAEAEGNPDPAARASVERVYGADRLERIELTIKMIRVANLLGNTFDYVLYRLCLGGGAGAVRE
ncbi:MAG: carboxymuconolactone decarboxylase family protein [Anaerolineae bacterium]|jgi:AhpD family alkylhydroperoxidase